ncbi:hypothetical protein JCM6882_008387 [Rhodosporidiobolus microsporus]
MPPRLPLELQLHITELALPPQTLRRLPARRQALKDFSLLHRDYTKPMQRLLYAMPHFDLAGDGVPERIKRTLNAADEIEAVVTGLDLSFRQLSFDVIRAEVLDLLKGRASTVRELAVFLRARGFPFFGEWLPNLTSLNVAGVLADDVAQYPPFAFPPRLTRLPLQRCGAGEGDGTFRPVNLVLPPIPTLRTLLIGPRVYFAPGLDFSASFPLLHTLAIDRDSVGRNAPGFFDLSTLPSTLAHFRLELPDRWTSGEALSFLLAIPRGGLTTLEVYLDDPGMSSVPEELERRIGWMQGVKVDFTTYPDIPPDIEEWTPVR